MDLTPEKIRQLIRESNEEVARLKRELWLAGITTSPLWWNFKNK